MGMEQLQGGLRVTGATPTLSLELVAEEEEGLTFSLSHGKGFAGMCWECDPSAGGGLEAVNSWKMSFRPCSGWDFGYDQHWGGVSQ